MLCKDSTCVRCPDLCDCYKSKQNTRLKKYQEELENCAKSANDSKALRTDVKLMGGYLYRLIEERAK